MNLLKRYRFFVVTIVLMIFLLIINQQIGLKALSVTGYSLKEMALVIPPIFILLGLLDIWVPREIMMKYMGEGSGIRKIILAVLLGSAAAGPLYGAFPIAAVFMKKGNKTAFANKNLISIVGTIFLVGFSVFGSFTYSGKLVESRTGYTVLSVGLILTLFGVATVIGGRKTPIVRERLKNKFLLFTGFLGSISLFIIAFMKNPIYIGIGLFGFGLAFVFLQSILVTKAQETMPKLRGTAMSLASFNMFVGGGIGTL